jgi:hypothetical protein
MARGEGTRSPSKLCEARGERCLTRRTVRPQPASTSRTWAAMVPRSSFTTASPTLSRTCASGCWPMPEMSALVSPSAARASTSRWPAVSPAGSSFATSGRGGTGSLRSPGTPASWRARPTGGHARGAHPRTRAHHGDHRLRLVGAVRALWPAGPRQRRQRLRPHGQPVGVGRRVDLKPPPRGHGSPVVSVAGAQPREAPMTHAPGPDDGVRAPSTRARAIRIALRDEDAPLTARTRAPERAPAYPAIVAVLA